MKQYMTDDQRRKLGKLPTTHMNCKDATGVSRPGKTARDKAKMSDARPGFKKPGDIDLLNEGKGV